MIGETLSNLHCDNELMSSSFLESITDGIFAVAITILTFSITIPTIGGLTQVTFPAYLSQLRSEIILFVICFIILGNNWITEREMLDSIEKTDKNLVYITLLFMMFVSLFPMIFSLVTNFGNEFPIFIQYYHLINLGMGVVLLIQWLYINDNNLQYKISTKSKGLGRFKELYNNNMNFKTSFFRTLYYPIIILISLLISFWQPGISRFLYIFIVFKPVLDKLNKKYFYKKFKSKIVDTDTYKNIGDLSSRLDNLPIEEKEYLKELVDAIGDPDKSYRDIDIRKVIDILVNLHPEIVEKLKKYAIELNKFKEENNENFDKNRDFEYFYKIRLLYNFYKERDLNLPILPGDED